MGTTRSRTLFQKIDLFDHIVISLKEEKGIEITTNCSELPVDQGNWSLRFLKS